MAYKTPHVITRVGTIGNNLFLPVFSGHANASTATEARAEVEMTFDGTFSDFQSIVRIANASGDTTFTLRLNGADSAITWTVPQNATGPHGDASNTVAFVAGDIVSIKCTTTAGSITELTSISFKIESDDGETRQIIGAYDSGAIAFATLPRFVRPAGEIVNNMSTEAVAQVLVQNDSVIEAVSVNVTSNARTVTSTITPRINSTNASLSVSFATTATGIFTQTGGTDAIVVDDLINTNFSAGGSGSISIVSIVLTIKSDNPREITMYHGNNISRPATDTANDFNMPGNRMSTSPTELAYSLYPKSGGVLSRMSIYASADSASTDLNIVMRVNGADGNQTLTQSSAGWLTDTTNSDTIDNNDYISQRTTRASVGSGTTTLRANSFLFTMDEISTLRIFMS